MTLQEFIIKANHIHNYEYDYSLTEYKNSHTKITIICLKHGSFYLTPNKHISSKQKCPKCAKQLKLLRCIDKYGVDHPLKNKEIQNKRTKTNIQKYGVSCPLQNNSILEKRNHTNLEKYGSTNPLNNQTIKQKAKQTNIIKYGVEYHQQSEEGKQQRIKTYLQKYGVDNPLKNKEIQKQIKIIKLKKYGVEFVHESHMVDILPLLENKEWLFNQYITLNKTATQIAQELEIDNTTIGNYLRKAEITIKQIYNTSYKATQWLQLIEQTNNITLITEYLIPGTKYKADGFCQETNTIYEFYGDYWHGNPEIYQPDELNEVVGKTMDELYQKTLDRENVIKSLGYNIIIIWENSFYV